MNKQLFYKVTMVFLWCSLVVGCRGVNSPEKATPSQTNSSITLTSQPSETSTPQNFPVDNWGMRWMEGIPCEAPCWEDIVPNVTTSDEAVLLLKRAPINEYTYHVFRTESLSWEWSDQNYDKYYGQIDFDTTVEPNVVNFIHISVPKSLSLQDLIDRFGEPRVAVMGWCNPFASFYLSFDFPAYGIWFGLSESQTPYIITPDMTFDGIYFQDPIDHQNTVDAGIYQEWQGYSAQYKTVNIKGNHEIFDSANCLQTSTP